MQIPVFVLIYFSSHLDVIVVLANVNIFDAVFFLF